jgi:hypothetical protein
MRFTIPSPRAILEITTAQVFRESAADVMMGTLRKKSANKITVNISGITTTTFFNTSDILSHLQ